MAVGHQKEPGEGQTDFGVDRLDLFHQAVHGDAFVGEQPLSRDFEGSRNKADLAPVAILEVVDVEGPVRKDAVGGRTRSLPGNKKAAFARDEIEPVGIGVEKRGVPRAIWPDLADDTIFQLGPLRLAQFAFDARPARQKTAHVDDAAAGTAAQPIDWPCELLCLDRGTAQNPGRLEQIVGVAGAIVGIDHPAGKKLDLAAERDLHEVGDAGTGRGKGEGGGPAPFGEFFPALAMPVPESVEVTADLGQFMLDPGAMIAQAGAVGGDNVVRVAPVGIVDGGDGEPERPC